MKPTKWTIQNKEVHVGILKILIVVVLVIIFTITLPLQIFLWLFGFEGFWQDNTSYTINRRAFTRKRR